MSRRQSATALEVKTPVDVLLAEHALHRRMLAVFERIARVVESGAAFPSNDVASVLGYLREFVELVHQRRESRTIYPESRWPSMQEVLTAKDAAERLLVASGVPYTIIRNAVLRNDAPGVREKAELTTDQKRFGAVTRSGLGRLTAECALNPACTNRIFHAVDPQVALPATH